MMHSQTSCFWQQLYWTLAHSSWAIASSSVAFLGLSASTTVLFKSHHGFKSGDCDGSCIFQVFQETKPCGLCSMVEIIVVLEGPMTPELQLHNAFLGFPGIWLNPSCPSHAAGFQVRKKQSSSRASLTHCRARLLFSVAYASQFLLQTRILLNHRPYKFQLCFEPLWLIYNLSWLDPSFLVL